ncbi:hypothetical protein NQZ68_014843 [Dissostichus eleginoides]|nr:hypothetical protein NQZ68_014843 [Dissostichus eleginoides]
MSDRMKPRACGHPGILRYKSMKSLSLEHEPRCCEAGRRAARAVLSPGGRRALVCILRTAEKSREETVGVQVQEEKRQHTSEEAWKMERKVRGERRGGEGEDSRLSSGGEGRGATADGESATKGRQRGGGAGSLSPLPSSSTLSSLEGLSRTGHDKKMEATQSSRQRCPFHLFQDNHVYMYITANYQSQLPTERVKGRENLPQPPTLYPPSSLQLCIQSAAKTDREIQDLGTFTQRNICTVKFKTNCQGVRCPHKEGAEREESDSEGKAAAEGWVNLGDSSKWSELGGVRVVDGGVRAQERSESGALLEAPRLSRKDIRASKVSTAYPQTAEYRGRYLEDTNCVTSTALLGSNGCLGKREENRNQSCSSIPTPCTSNPPTSKAINLPQYRGKGKYLEKD